MSNVAQTNAKASGGAAPPSAVSPQQRAEIAREIAAVLIAGLDDVITPKPKPNITPSEVAAWTNKCEAARSAISAAVATYEASGPALGLRAAAEQWREADAAITRAIGLLVTEIDTAGGDTNYVATGVVKILVEARGSLSIVGHVWGEIGVDDDHDADDDAEGSAS